VRSALVAVALLTLAPAAAAQGRPNPCRSVASVDSVTVELTRSLFYGDSEYGDSVNARIRAHFGIQKLAPSAPVVPVRDVAVCEEWLPAIAVGLQSDYGAAHTTEGYLFEMVQYGPYMLVFANIDPATVPPGVSLAANRISMLIFEVAGKRYLGVML
jgi:hypothetical protein